MNRPGDGDGSEAVASCPVCTRSFRPRSLVVSAWCSVVRHVSARSRQGCGPHRHLHDALHGRSRETFGCPGCPERFDTVADACLHLMTSGDALHQRYRAEDRSWAGADGERRQRRALRRDEGEDLAPEQELYGLAKAGDLQGVRQLLQAGADPNSGGEDGYTPLMTASEAGHAEVVALLAADPRCNLNAQNTYGQTALSLSAQNNHRGAVAALIAAPAGAGREKLAIDLLCGKHTAAELARRAGHSALADILAEQSRQGQISLLMSALLDGGAASGLFDSLGARLTALRQAAGLAAPPLEADDDPGDVMGWKPVCTICMTQDADTALKPCFHACFCGSCADALLAGGAGVALCPICRVYVLETQHVFL